MSQRVDRTRYWPWLAANLHTWRCSWSNHECCDWNLAQYCACFCFFHLRKNVKEHKSKIVPFQEKSKEDIYKVTYSYKFSLFKQNWDENHGFRSSWTIYGNCTSVPLLLTSKLPLSGPLISGKIMVKKNLRPTFTSIIYMASRSNADF